ncbi:hypothetical protein BD413DRAFT_86217 [Trametes elegans]|nr:hypothetical protein BD413DRAFT_86217 [Trametes elegans]
MHDPVNSVACVIRHENPNDSCGGTATAEDSNHSLGNVDESTRVGALADSETKRPAAPSRLDAGSEDVDDDPTSDEDVPEGDPRAWHWFLGDQCDEECAATPRIGRIEINVEVEEETETSPVLECVTSVVHGEVHRSNNERTQHEELTNNSGNGGDRVPIEFSSSH